ncbi:TIGR03086 family metal-binding protein, partial [Saccharomonospora iraqiensis]|uniref:TIGR03086 family metal-binding protein n=1 Tax=Saccharomonospora iraqiensis TaxID=52698 RepID=UPI00022DED41
MNSDTPKDYIDVLPGAATGLKTVAAGIGPDVFTNPTPCEVYDVRGLANHLFYWAPVLTAAGRGEPAPSDRPAESDVDLAGPDWPDRVPAVVDEIVAAWSSPSAWQGTARYGTTDLPATVAGSIVLVELVVHGWDLARATGRDYPVDPAAADAALEILGWL